MGDKHSLLQFSGSDEKLRLVTCAWLRQDLNTDLVHFQSDAGRSTVIPYSGNTERAVTYASARSLFF